MNGKELLDKLLSTQFITIRDEGKRVVGMARYATTNNPAEEYIKVAFSDGSGIFFPLALETTIFYFAQKIGTAEGVTDESIKNGAPIVWNSKKFHVVNKMDYQYVKQLYIGKFHEIEGEVRFSDYEDETGNVLSVGWSAFEGKRDDVYAEPIGEQEISI